MTTYSEWAGFEYLHLEDSYVLDIEAHPGHLAVHVEAVLDTEHPRYSRPRPNEAACFQRITIHFHNVRRLHWIQFGIKPSMDACGELDYGGIDSLIFADDSYVIHGSFGQVEIEANECNVQYGNKIQ